MRRKANLPALGWVTGVCAALSLACQDPLASLDAQSSASFARVALDPEAPLNATPRVVRFRIDLSPELTHSLSVGQLELFSDEVSAYHQGRLARGETPEALLQRRVPMLSWQVNPSTMFAQPTEVLVPQATYTLFAIGYRELARIQVQADDDTPLLTRVWPGPAWSGGNRGGLYCAEAKVSLKSASILLAPDAIEASFEPSKLLSEYCAVLEVPEAASIRVPATATQGYLLDPAPLADPGEGFELNDIACESACQPLPPGCVCPQDDRAVVVGPEHPAFFQIEVGQGMEQFETFQKSAAVLLGLTPERVQAVTGDAFDLYGRRRDVVGQFLTLAPRAHLAINEVYADANGPEPQQEWLELVNSGTVAENLAGYVLEDVGGETELPAVIVEAGAYAVIVNADYVPDPELDIVAEPSALLLRVERLGKSGLSNSGELLRLQSPTGEVVSRFPMRPQPKPGISVARRAPWSMDGDSSAFGLHRAPGASPGSPNQLQSELD